MGGIRLAVHADWSARPAKCWITRAIRCGDAWHMQAPEPVGEAGSLLSRLRLQAGGGGIAFGIDCPIGLPRAYVQRHLQACDNFPGFLAGLADVPGWLEVCASLDEVSGLRPFYPRSPARGMTRAAHAAALGLADADALFRVCDRATPTRAAGAPPFWTLGANQSGKAAIAAWRDLLLPELCRAPGRLHLWPFDGDLAAWVACGPPAGSVLLAETYPAEALDQLCLRLGKQPGPRGSKRRQADRAALAEPLRLALGRLRAIPSPALDAALLDGFGSDAAGEDRFDSLLGLTCLLSVLAGQRSEGVPDDVWVRRWEGWVLGLTPPGLTCRTRLGSAHRSASRLDRQRPRSMGADPRK